MPPRLSTITLALLAAGLGSCGAPPPRAAPPADRPALPEADRSPAVRSAAAMTAARLPEDAAIPLATLVDLARRTTPDHGVAEADRAAAIAAMSQARGWANPEVEFGIGRSRARQADETGGRSGTTIGGIRLSQRFELPGKRASRIAAADTGTELAERTAAVDDLDLVLEVHAAAVAVTLADLQTAQARAMEELATRIHATVASRREAGEADQGDLARATAELATARLAEDAAERAGGATRAALRTWCGEDVPLRFTVADALPEVPEDLDLAAAQARARTAHPRLALLTAQAGAADAAAAREERAWYPDLTVGVSGGRESDADEVGVTLGMEIPLWNRNDGGIAQARAEAARIVAERRRERAALERRILAAWNAYEHERRQVVGLGRDLLPSRREALQLKLDAYGAGDAALFDLIDARRDLLTAEQELLDARSRAATARIELARAIGVVPPISSHAVAPPAASAPTSSPSPRPVGAAP